MSTKSSDEKIPFGDRAADKLARWGRSWRFIIGLNLGMLAYVVYQTFMGIKAFDPYPFILLNLFMSWMASNQAPIIMMSQARQDAIIEMVIYQIHAMLQSQHLTIGKLTTMQTHQADIIEALHLMLKELSLNIQTMKNHDDDLSHQLDEFIDRMGTDNGE